MGVQYTVGKVFSRPFQGYIISPQIPKILVGKSKKYLQFFSDCIAGWSKEPQWENDCDFFFRNVFYECIEGKSGICLLLTKSIGNDWMVDLTIISIENTIAKALDINNIIQKKNNYGMSAR